MPNGFRGVGTTASGNSPTSLTFAAPANTAATDLVYTVLFGGQAAVTDALPTITPPAGWTQAALVNDIPTNAQWMAVYWGLGSASFAAWTFSGSTEAIIGWAQGYTGADNGTPMDATAVGQANAASTVWTAPSITTVTANAWLVGFFGGFLAAVPTFSAEFGTHRKNDSFTDSFAAVEAIDSADTPQAVAGASGTKTVTSSVSNVSIGILTALRPAAGAATFEDDSFRTMQFSSDAPNVSIWQ